MYYNGDKELWIKSNGNCDRDVDESSFEEEAITPKMQSENVPGLPDFEANWETADEQEQEGQKNEQEKEGQSDSGTDSEGETWEDDEGNIDSDYPQTTEESSTNDDIPDLPESQTHSCSSRESVLRNWLLLFFVRFQARFYISDIAMACLLKFVYIFLSIIGRYSTFVSQMMNNFPTSIFLLKQSVNNKETFVRYVVCRKCYSVYDYKKCIEKNGTSFVSKKCTYRPHRTYRKCCNTILLKTVNLKNGTKKLIPYRVYCYNSLQASLQQLLLRPSFNDLCEQWRHHEKSSTLFSDIYDGKIWNEFQYIDGQPFLATHNVYAFMVNIDWFQPYKHTNHSTGAIYLTVLNLPCSVRYKRENTILLGILPGPSEPEKNINQFLRPLVKELQEFYHGIPMDIPGQDQKQNVRYLLIGVSCDMPAGRKVCGFLSHSAHLGCCKCLKVFPGKVGEKDYSGFERSSWKRRTNLDHRRAVRTLCKARNLTEQNQLESKFGCRYSVLLDLPYFDPTRMLVIDPMHNLFLGSAKTMTKIWFMHDILTSDNINSVQKMVDNMKVPTHIGRIPRKIETKFSGFTADQYKSWTMYYSIPSMYEILNKSQLECWRPFVLACRLLCQKSISEMDVSVADVLLTQFCQRIQNKYGKNAVTPNMHMHCHLKEVILDYGPVYTFWLFSYERFNGILQHQPTSNRSIEIEVMRRFIRDNNSYDLEYPEDFRDELANVVCDLQPSTTGTLLLISQKHTSNSVQAVEVPTCYKYHVLGENELSYLKKMLGTLLSKLPDQISLNSVCKRFKFVHINDFKFLSSSIAVTHWNQSVLGSYPTKVRLTTEAVNPVDESLRPFKFEYFASISYHVTTDDHSEPNSQVFTFAFVSWFKLHPSRFEIGKPVQLWCNDLYEKDDFYSIMPLDELHNFNIKHCVYTSFQLSRGTSETLLLIVPMV